MPLPNIDDTLFKLFDVINAIVGDSGGDGDGWIVSDRYRELADKYSLYLIEKDNWFNSRCDQDGIITFSNNQETICFVNSTNFLPSDYDGDIIVQFDYYEIIRKKYPGLYGGDHAEPTSV